MACRTVECHDLRGGGAARAGGPGGFLIQFGSQASRNTAAGTTVFPVKAAAATVSGGRYPWVDGETGIDRTLPGPPTTVAGTYSTREQLWSVSTRWRF